MKWIVILGVLVVLLVVGDMQARKYAERQVAHVITTHEPGATAKVRISSFPFVGRLAAYRKVQKISAVVRNVSFTTTVGNATLAEVDLTLAGVKVDLGPLAAGSNGAVKSIRSGTVQAQMTEQALDSLVKLPVKLGNGAAQVTVAGVTVNGSVSITQTAAGDVLQLSGGGQAINVTIPAIPVLPCVANVVIGPGRLTLSCAFTQVPAALLQAAQGTG